MTRWRENATVAALVISLAVVALRVLASAGEAGTATTPKSDVVHEHAVGAAETPNPSSPSGKDET